MVALLYKLYDSNEEQTFKFLVLFFKSKDLQDMYCDGIPLYNVMYATLKELMIEFHCELIDHLNNISMPFEMIGAVT